MECTIYGPSQRGSFEGNRCLSQESPQHSPHPFSAKGTPRDYHPCRHDPSSEKITNRAWNQTGDGCLPFAIDIHCWRTPSMSCETPQREEIVFRVIWSELSSYMRFLVIEFGVALEYSPLRKALVSLSTVLGVSNCPVSAIFPYQTVSQLMLTGIDIEGEPPMHLAL